MRKCSFDFDLLKPTDDEVYSVKSRRTESFHSAKVCQQQCPYTPLAGKFDTLTDDNQKAHAPDHGPNSYLGQQDEADFLCDPKECRHKHCDGLSGGNCDGHDDFVHKHFHPCHKSDCQMKSLEDQCMEQCQSCIDDCVSCQVDVSSLVNTPKDRDNKADESETLEQIIEISK